MSRATVVMFQLYKIVYLSILCFIAANRLVSEIWMGQYLYQSLLLFSRIHIFGLLFYWVDCFFVIFNLLLLQPATFPDDSVDIRRLRKFLWLTDVAVYMGDMGLCFVHLLFIRFNKTGKCSQGCHANERNKEREIKYYQKSMSLSKQSHIIF